MIALGLGARSRDEGRYRERAPLGPPGARRRLSRGGPVVLVFEDVHLADQFLLDPIESFVRSAKGVPVLVLCVARYELLDQRLEWGGKASATRSTCTWSRCRWRKRPSLPWRLARGWRPTPRGASRRTAGGNPFFIVETTGMLMQARVEPSGAGLSSSPRLPPTVQAVIAARIDHLPPAARELVRKASVFPRATFHVSELALTAEPDDALALLQDEELLIHDGSAPWRFRHGSCGTSRTTAFRSASASGCTCA